MKQLDQLKINGKTDGNSSLMMINCKWVLSRIQRKQEWINGMVEQIGWKIIHINHTDFGNEDYYIRGDLTFDDILKEWNSYASVGYYEKNDEKNYEKPMKNDENLPF